MAVLRRRVQDEALASSNPKPNPNPNWRRVQDEALASLSALEASEKMISVANRLGRMVYGEFGLFSEGEASRVRVGVRRI